MDDINLVQPPLQLHMKCVVSLATCSYNWNLSTLFKFLSVRVTTWEWLNVITTKRVVPILNTLIMANLGTQSDSMYMPIISLEQQSKVGSKAMQHKLYETCLGCQLWMDNINECMQLPSIARETCDFSSYMFIVEYFHCSQVIYECQSDTWEWSHLLANNVTMPTLDTLASLGTQSDPILYVDYVVGVVI